MSQEEKKRKAKKKNKWQQKMLRNFGKNQRPLLTVAGCDGRGWVEWYSPEWATGRFENFADFLTRRPGRRQQQAESKRRAGSGSGEDIKNFV